MLTRPTPAPAAVPARSPKRDRIDSPVTLPPTLPATATPAPVIPPAPVRFPLSWLLEHAAAPIQYRAITEVVRLTDQIGGRVALLPYTYRPALMLALQQQLDGTWNHSMLTVPSARADNFEGVG